LKNNKILIFGGAKGVSPTVPNDIPEILDPAAYSATAITDIPSQRRGFPLVAAPNGRVYAIGGKNAGGYLTTVEYFDPDDSKWH